VEVSIVALILLSILLLVLETALRSGPWVGRLRVAGDVITAAFVLELSLRFWVAPRKRRFFLRFWPDLLAVLPVLRPLRFLRVLMLLRIFRAGALFNRRLSVFRGTLRATLQEVTLLLTLSLAMVLAGSFALQVAERGNENARLDTLSETLWYAAYIHVSGEPIGGEPTTGMGRAATLLLMLGGMTIFGVFIGTVSASMSSRLANLEVNAMDLDELSGHTVIFGWNRAGPLVLQELFAGDRQGASIVLVTEQQELVPALPPDGIRAERLYRVVGDYTRVDILERVSIHHAATAILLADSQIPRSDQDRDARTVLAALTIEKIQPDIFTVAELTNRQNEQLLRLARVDEIVVASDYGATVIGSAARNRGVVTIVDEILTSRYGNAFQKVVVPAGWADRSVRELFVRLKDEQDAVLVALVRAVGGDEGEVLVNPPADAVVRLGDRLVVLSVGPVVL
jgi:voltage-gated potassium channel